VDVARGAQADPLPLCCLSGLHLERFSFPRHSNQHLHSNGMFAVVRSSGHSSGSCELSESFCTQAFAVIFHSFRLIDSIVNTESEYQAQILS